MKHQQLQKIRVKSTALARNNITYSWNCKVCKSETEHYMCDDKCKPCKLKYRKSPMNRQEIAKMIERITL